MSLTTLDYVEAPCYITPSYGDIDQDPNQAELCTSVNEDDAKEVIDQTTGLQTSLETFETLSQNLKDLQNSKDSVEDSQDDPPIQSIRTTFNVAEKISEVNRGTYQTRCHNRPKHDSPQGASEFGKEEIELMIQNNYQKNRDGIIEMVNKLHLKRQKKVLGYLIKQFGSNLFAGKTVAGLSLPVTIFEPRSHLERTAAGLTFAPYFLRQGGNSTDTLEQFKFAIAHFVSSLHLLINPQKPFNPLLGETFEGVIDGCHIYMEQVSHHPPVSAYQMIGENFKVEGVTESTAAMAANSIKSRKMGFPTVKYNNTKTTIRALHPSGLMQGTTFGKRTFQFTDKFYIFDIENRYYCEIEFEPTGSSVLKKKKNSKDSFTGNIWKINGRFAQMLKQNIEKSKDLNVKFKEKEHAENKLETLEGCWLEYLKIGRDTVWSFGNPWPYKLQYIDNPLPSDSNYRLDVLHLRAEDEVKSQDHKVIYEEIQRKDRRLREQAKNRMKK